MFVGPRPKTTGCRQDACIDLSFICLAETSFFSKLHAHPVAASCPPGTDRMNRMNHPNHPVCIKSGKPMIARTSRRRSRTRENDTPEQTPTGCVQDAGGSAGGNRMTTGWVRICMALIHSKYTINTQQIQSKHATNTR